MFGLTKRQLICFIFGGIASVPTFFLLKGFNPTLATLGMVLTASPFFIAGLFKKNQQTLEVLLKNVYIVKFGGKPRLRLYKNENFYEQLERQYNLDSEIRTALKGGKSKRKVKSKAKNINSNKSKVTKNSYTRRNVNESGNAKSKQGQKNSNRKNIQQISKKS